ncbi:MAG: DUF2711 family protein [Cyanobacteria bacterium P01_A01_bin.83]
MANNRVLPEPDKFASCPYHGKILSYYGEQFEAVFIVLHPFLRPKSDKLKYFRPDLATQEDHFPTDEQILSWCSPVTWAEFLKASGIDSLQNLDGALRNYISGLIDRKRFQSYTDALVATLQREDLVAPNEGDIPSILLPRICQVLQALDYKWAWLGDEFCTERKLKWIDDLNTTKFYCHGCIFTPDRQILLVSHWDSHCTFLCSNEDNIAQLVKEAELEGFYCTPKTEVYWGLYEI